MHKAWTQAHPSLLLHSLSLLLQMRLWTITAITAMGATFQKATRHYLYHLSHMTGLGWASALFQMMNLRCIVPLLSLPGPLANPVLEF